MIILRWADLPRRETTEELSLIGKYNMDVENTLWQLLLMDYCDGNDRSWLYVNRMSQKSEEKYSGHAFSGTSFDGG